MSLTPEEHTNALALKAQLAQDPDAPSLSDFEIAQHAIVAKGDVERGVRRAKKLYALRSDFEERAGMPGVDALRFVAEKSPGLFTAVGADAAGRSVACTHAKAFKTRDYNEDKDMTTLMAGIVALLDALCCDLATTREGSVFIADSAGTGWDSFSAELEKRLVDVYQDSYPLRTKEYIMVDAPFIVNAMIAIVKVFLSKKMRDTIVLKNRAQFTSTTSLARTLLPPALGGTFNNEEVMPELERRLALRASHVSSFTL